MIYIVDVCKAWVHEECSAGMISLIERSFPTEQIVLCAERKHIHALENVGIPKKVKTITLDFPQMNTVEALWALYCSCLNNLLKNLKQGDYVFSLASEKPLIEAMYFFSKKNAGVKFLLVLHGTMELALEQQPFSKRLSKMNMSARQGWRKRIAEVDDAFFPIDKIIRKSIHYPNIKFITYGPCAIDELRHVFSDEVMKKFMFLHIPMVSYGIPADTKASGKIRIGIWGNCVNDYAQKIISYVNQKTTCDNYEFIILKKKQIVLGKRFKNTKIYEPNGDGFTRGQMKRYLQSFDYALIPYAKDKYRVSCSGVLADAIACGIPILALKCSPCSYYNERYHIGIVKESVKLLGDEIIRLASSNEIICSGVNVVGQMHQENLETMRGNI